MMKRSRQFIGFLMVIGISTHLSSTLYGQGANKKAQSIFISTAIELRELKVGDKIPDIPIALTNSSKTSSRLSDFAGSYLILDFWATWCLACIKKFPELASLQKKYSNENLKIVLVNSCGTGDNLNSISAFFKKRKSLYAEDFNLPSIVNDSALELMFPHRTVPHYILIDPGGTVKAITFSEQITESTIKDFISGKVINLPLKKEDMTFDKSQPLFENGNGGYRNKSLFRSFLSSYIEGLPISIGYNRNDSNLITRFYAINLSIIGLYKYAYSDLFAKFPQNRIVLEVKDPFRYEFDPKNRVKDWKYKNAYTYELILPPAPIEQVNQYFRSDLERYFNLKIYSQKRFVDCLVISKSDRSVDRQRDGKLTQHNSAENSPESFVVTSIKELIGYLNSQVELPVIDETNLTDNIVIKGLNSDLTRSINLQALLRKYGLQVVEQQREVELLIISE